MQIIRKRAAGAPEKRYFQGRGPVIEGPGPGVGWGRGVSERSWGDKAVFPENLGL